MCCQCACHVYRRYHALCIQSPVESRISSTCAIDMLPAFVCMPLLGLVLSAARPLAPSHAAQLRAVKPPCMAGNLFKILEMPGGKASALMEQYKDRIANMRANGFQPNVECWMPARQPQVKQMGESMRELSLLAKAVGACTSTLAATDAVGSDPESERVARTRVTIALAATGGTAIALASEWPDHVSIDACVCSPAQLAVGEVAEKALIKHLTEQALDRGITDVRIANSDSRFFQLNGNHFYESCGFYAPADGDAPIKGQKDAATRGLDQWEPIEPTVLSYRAPE